jgi:hypothetical protein
MKTNHSERVLLPANPFARQLVEIEPDAHIPD